MLTKQKNSRKQKSSLSVGKITSYVAVFLLLTSVIAVGYQKPQSLAQLNQTASVPNSAMVLTTDEDKAPSVDEIVATDVAAGITEQANLPIAPTVANEAVSLAAKSELAQTDDTVISKPQIVQPTSGSRTIRYYTAKSGDTVADVAAKYQLSERTVRWANDLESDIIPRGKRLTILPVDGIQYTFRSGDSVRSLANRFKTSQARIISYNDLELSKPRAGQRLIIPDGVLPATQRPGYEAPDTGFTGGNGFGGGMAINSSIARASAGNRYAPGYCTWYAYERRVQLGLPVGSFWGNASTWASYASAAGLRVDDTPAPGAILQHSAGLGHVGIIESVDWKRGTVTYTDMNGIAGFGAVGRDTIPISQAKAQWQFIH